MRCWPAAALMAVAGCTATRAPDTHGTVRVVVSAVAAPATLSHVTASVTPDGPVADLSYAPADGSFGGELSVAAGAHTVTATAYAGSAAVASASAPVTVVAGQATLVLLTLLDATGPAPLPDHAPVVTSLVVPADPVPIGTSVTLSAAALDLDGDPLTWSWLATPPGCGTLSPANAADARFTGSAVGTCAVEVVVTARDKSDARTADVVVSGPSTWSISGTISPAARGAGAAIALAGAATAATTADASGVYTFRDLRAGSYTVTPSKAGVTFGPATASVTLSGGAAVVDFAAVSRTPNVVVDASLGHQTLDGMGSNINVNSWKAGELRPALDRLVDENGATLFRVICDPMDWVASEALIPRLHQLDPATLTQVYEQPRMQDLWSVIGHLNAKGIRGRQILINFMGWTPTWLGGSGRYNGTSYVTAGKEASFATMVASLVYYGRVVRGLDFALVSPLNEPNLNGLEGPLVGAAQYVTIMAALGAELDGMGQTAVGFVGPDTFNDLSYVAPMMGNASVASRTVALGYHMYGGPAWTGTSYAGKSWWITETAEWDTALDRADTPPAMGEWPFARNSADIVLWHVMNGFAGVLLWEGYDSFWYHHDALDGWGLLGYDATSHAYLARKRFFTNAHVNRFLVPGTRRIGASTTATSLDPLVAVRHPGTGRLAVVGHNRGNSPLTIDVQLKNVTSLPAALAVYETSATQDLQAMTPVTVVGNVVAITVPADTFFAISN